MSSDYSQPTDGLWSEHVYIRSWVFERVETRSMLVGEGAQVDLVPILVTSPR